MQIKFSKFDKADRRYKTQKDRAQQFKVSLKIIEHIDSGRAWAWLKEDDNSHEILKWQLQTAMILNDY